MITGTSGRAACTSGRSSSPVMPGMLMSENIRIRLAPVGGAMQLQASGAECAKSMAKRPERSSRRNCCRNRSVTSGSSSTTRMRTLMSRSFRVSALGRAPPRGSMIVNSVN